MIGRGGSRPRTIFALSSGAPPAAIAVVRISGPDARDVLPALGARVPPARIARVVRLVDPVGGETLDRALALWFPGPRSATGEDLLELHLHGGRAIVMAVLAALRACPGLGDAEAGEFTRRALSNGRMDLAQAEGLADLLEAQTEDQRRHAQRIADGGLSREVEVWRRRVIDHAAQIEAVIDYGDEVDVDIGPLQSAMAADGLELAKLTASPPAERLHDGLRVVLAGPPNAGKSSLLNALAGRDAAIVSPIAGTTRDRIEVPIVLDGIPLILSDTAGLRDATSDAIEEIGMARAREAVAQADIVLWLGEDQEPDGAIRIAAKADLYPMRRGIAVSAVAMTGLDDVRRAVIRRARQLMPRDGDLALNIRQMGLMSDCRGALAAASIEDDLILMAEHLRRALLSLDRITGRAGTEDMLDALFGRFCLGK